MMMYRCNAWAVTGGMVSLLVMSAQPALAAVAVAGDGQILFGGSLVAQTCTISVNNKVGSTSNIALPKVSRTGMVAEGSTKGGTVFTFKLTSCSGSTATKAKVFFLGGPRVNSDGTLANTITSHGATGVALQLYDASMNPILIGDSSQLNQPATTFGGLMGYTAQYVVNSDAVGSGPFSTSVTYAISYQ